MAFGEHAAILGDLGLERLQPLLHRRQIVPQPDAADPEGRDLGAALLQLVRGPRLAPGGLIDGHRHHRRLDLRRGAVLQVGLGAGDLGQRQVTAFFVEVAEAVEAVPRIAHHPAGLGHAAQLLGQLQQADLRLDHFALGHRHRGLSGEPAGALRSAWLRAPASIPTNQGDRQITSRLLQITPATPDLQVSLVHMPVAAGD